MSQAPCPQCGGLHPQRADACCEFDLVGRTFAGGLRVLEKLSDTSHGSLYRAEYAESGAEVELISLCPDAFEGQPSGEGSKLRRLWEQLSRAGAINHPNIARVEEIRATAEGVRYVVFEVVRGELLSDILNIRHALPPEEALELILQATSGLQAAHEVGVPHGNLSPDSILVTRTHDNRPLVKLIRFGLAQNGELYTDYAAPERLAGHPGDERSDIFSLAAVLHHLLAGEPPGSELAEAELIPEGARSVISRALEPLPGQRFGTAAAFGRALAAVHVESGVEQRKRRRPWAAAIAIGAGLGVVVTAGVWLLRSTERPPPNLPGERSMTTSEAARAAKPSSSPPSVVKRAPATPRSTASEVQDSIAAVPKRAKVAAANPNEAPPSVPAEPSTVPPKPQKQFQSSVITPGNVEAGGGAAARRDDTAGRAGPETPAQSDSVLSYRSSPATESPPPSPATLTRSEAMRRALSDVTRLGLVVNYEEVSPGLLVLNLGRAYGSSTSVEYNLKRLYAAYVNLLGYPENHPVVELWQNGTKIGEYTNDGLLVGPE